MNILMMTNTYLPHVGGVARSVATFAEGCRRRGHACLIVAPTFEGDLPDDEEHVVRVPAIEHFNGSDFSVRLPIPGLITDRVEAFAPDIVHSHHPFLLGDTALRAAVTYDCPLVFTHHTMYERYLHYVPVKSNLMGDFTIRLVTAYANMSDHVIAPSESVRDILREREITSPITVVPTGIDPKRFAKGDCSRFRKQQAIPADAFVVGHVGRLAEEKNLPFLADTVAAFAKNRTNVHVLIVGDGDSKDQIEQHFDQRGLASRLHLTGSLNGDDLVNAYHAMDVFVFASQTETQGMVLAEAMTAGVPVVAVDAPGVREVVVDGQNGRLLDHEDAEQFCEALKWIADRDKVQTAALSKAARKTADAFSVSRSLDRLLHIYEQHTREVTIDRAVHFPAWDGLRNRISIEWDLWAGRMDAAIEVVADHIAENNDAKRLNEPNP